MGYDRGDSFPFDFEPSGNSLVSKSKENYHHDPIPFNVEGNGNIVFSVYRTQTHTNMCHFVIAWFYDLCTPDSIF